LEQTYRRILRAALRSPWWVLGWSATALAVALLVIFPVLGFEFLPASDQGQVSIVVETAPGASLAATDAIARKVETRLSRFADVAHTMTTVGEVMGGFGAIPQRGPQFAQINVRLRERTRAEDRLPRLGGVPQHRRLHDDQALAAAMRASLADITEARISVAPVRTVANVGPDVQIELRADPQRQKGSAGLAALAATADRIRRRLREVPGVVDPDTSVRTGQPEMHVEIDRALAAAADVPPALAGAILRDALDGSEAGRLEYLGEALPISVSLTDRDRSNPDLLWEVPVGQNRSQPVLLGDISHMVLRSGPAAVERINGQRSATVTAALAPGYALGNVRADIERRIARDVPEGIEARFGGESNVLDENIPHFALAVALAVVLVFLVTAALFNSLVHPLLMMLTLPMALIGGLGALALCGETLSLVSAIGVIMLTGLMGRNAILLIDYTNTLRARGMPVLEALTEAGATRLRPILMTTLATIFGMLPVALRLGRAAELRAPMAIVVIGGLLVSTVLTLVVIPAAYALVSGAASRTRD